MKIDRFLGVVVAWCLVFGCALVGQEARGQDTDAPAKEQKQRVKKQRGTGEQKSAKGQRRERPAKGQHVGGKKCEVTGVLSVKDSDDGQKRVVLTDADGTVYSLSIPQAKRESMKTMVGQSVTVKGMLIKTKDRVLIRAIESCEPVKAAAGDGEAADDQMDDGDDE